MTSVIVQKDASDVVGIKAAIDALTFLTSDKVVAWTEGSNVFIMQIPTDGTFYFTADTYFTYNSGTSRLELWVNGVKQTEWG